MTTANDMNINNHNLIRTCVLIATRAGSRENGGLKTVSVI
jgi:hypothetical protein